MKDIPELIDSFKNIEKKELRVLFLGGARRVAFAQKLIEAGRKRGVNVKIYSYELDHCVPIAAVGTVLLGRKFSGPQALNHLVKSIAFPDIRVVIPFVDPAIEIAARLKSELPEVYIPVGSTASATLTFDKILTDEALAKKEIPRPERVVDLQSADYPIILKPRRGSASKGIIIARNGKEAEKEIAEGAKTDDYLIQRYIEHRCELTVDCFVDNQGEVLACVPRQRLEVIGGEAVKTITVYSPAAVALAKRTIEELQLRGAVTIQLICDSSRQPIEWLVMEINARLGGGVVASINAGADIPGLIIDSALGEPVLPQQYTPNVLTARYLADVVIPTEYNHPENGAVKNTVQDTSSDNGLWHSDSSDIIQ